MNFKQLRTDALIGISLANLTLLRVWSELLTSSPRGGYTQSHPPHPVDLAAAMLDVCWLATLFCVVAAIARRRAPGRSALQWGLVLSLGLPANALRQVLVDSGFSDWGGQTFRHGGSSGVLAAALAGAFLSVGALVGWRDRMARFASVALLIASPFALVTFSKAILGIVCYNPAAFADKKLAMPVQVGLPQRRLLWLIFDEMDERLTFVDRNPGLDLPELDRFRTASFFASDARSPDNGTLRSLPALINGQKVTEARELAPDDLLLTYGSGKSAHWRSEPNVFSRAREAGFDTALAGWYHPYCRMLNDSLTECAWAEFPKPCNSTGDALLEVGVNQIRSVMETSLLSPFGQPLTTRHHTRNYHYILAAARAYAANPRVGLALVHFPIPHPPYIYNSRTGRFDLSNSPLAGYTDALVLADRTLGHLRSAMQAAGLWEHTAVLISADHGYRGAVSVDGGKIEDRWVPFLLKLPGQHEYYEYRPRLDTVRSADLLLDILSGKVATAADVAASLEGPGVPPARMQVGLPRHAGAPVTTN